MHIRDASAYDELSMWYNDLLTAAQPVWSQLRAADENLYRFALHMLDMMVL